jgi:hypothetical protein
METNVLCHEYGEIAGEILVEGRDRDVKEVPFSDSDFMGFGLLCQE